MKPLGLRTSGLCGESAGPLRRASTCAAERRRRQAPRACVSPPLLRGRPRLGVQFVDADRMLSQVVTDLRASPKVRVDRGAMKGPARSFAY